MVEDVVYAARRMGRGIHVQAQASPRPSAAITLEAIAVPGHGRSSVQVSAIKLRSSNALLAIPGVVGHGIGMDADGNYVIQVYLAEESPAARARIPRLLDGVSVITKVTGPFEAR